MDVAQQLDLLNKADDLRNNAIFERDELAKLISRWPKILRRLRLRTLICKKGKDEADSMLATYNLQEDALQGKVSNLKLTSNQD